MINEFFRGVIVGIWLTSTISIIVWSLYTVNRSAVISFSDHIKVVSRLIKDMTPPSLEVINKRISMLSHRERAFALIRYDESQKLFANRRSLVQDNRMSILERKSLQEFALAGEGFNEYRSFLQFKYNVDIGSEEAVLALPLP